MVIDEFLIKLGFNTEGVGRFSNAINTVTVGANKVSAVGNEISNSMAKAANDTGSSFDKVKGKVDETGGALSKTKVMALAVFAGMALLGNKLASAFNSAIDNAKNLYYQKNALFKISKDEINQAAQYKKSMAATGMAIDSIKTKIALNLAPSITQISNGFRGWLTVNKDLIANGITQVIKFLGKAIQVIVNVVRFIDKIISSTIGWKNALTILGIAWAVFNRALLFSPIGIVIGLITALMLVIDDLMTYMDGGDSLFGEYWEPLIEGAKLAWKTIQLCWNLIKSIWSGDTEKIKSYGKDLFDSYIKYLKGLFTGIQSILSSILKSVLQFFGMSESEASKTVDRIGKIFNFIIDLITLPFRAAYNAVTAIMDYFGIDAGDVVNTIVQVFSALFDVLVAPFKFAWGVISDLFDIWEDESSSLVDKIIESFSMLGAKLIEPFQFALKWVKDKFMGGINAVKNGIKSALSFFGIGGGDEPANDKFNTDSFNAQAGATNNSTKTVNQGSTTNNITVNTSDTNVAADQVGGIFTRQLLDANNNARSAIGAF